jgi:hypothetical protein
MAFHKMISKTIVQNVDAEKQSEHQPFTDRHETLMKACEEMRVLLDHPVAAHTPEQEQSVSFWEAMMYYPIQDDIHLKMRSFYYWFGYWPTNKEKKRQHLKEAARLFTDESIHADQECDAWLQQHGQCVFANYGWEEWSDVMKMSWE